MKENTILTDRQTGRNYGIDALRLVSMFMVVILHILGHGGVLENAGGKEYYLSYAFESFSYCAVDCYAIISGYVAFSDKEKPINYGKYGKLWVQVFFYSFVITLLFFFIQPSTVTKMDIVHSLFPLSYNKYWYFTEYTALFFLMPWTNKLIRALSKKETSILAIVIICLFSVYTTFIQRDTVGFKLLDGYSFVWLLLMYIIGCWMKKCSIPERIKSVTALILLAIFAFVPYAYYLLSSFLELDLGIRLINYTSIFTFGTAVLLIILFSQIKVTKAWGTIIGFLSPAAFGVYLIHEHPCIRTYLIKNNFGFISDSSIWIIPIIIIGCALAVFVTCLFVERLRLFVFQKLKINELAVKTTQKLINVLHRLLHRFIVE